MENLMIEGSKPPIFFTREGRVYETMDKNGNPFLNYEYWMKDLQVSIGMGNTRVRFTADKSEVTPKEYTDYYAFGMQHYNLDFATDGVNNYLYNGKSGWISGQTDFGLDWYDYGARFYDPSVPRFWTMDPQAEAYYNLSPYGYCAGNPIINVDVAGEFIGTIIGTVVGVVAGAYDAYKSGGDMWAGAAEGAVSGAITGATVDLVVAATVATGGGALVVVGAGAAAGAIGGAAGAVVGDATGQVVTDLNKGADLSTAVSNISTNKMADKAVNGAITGAIGGTVSGGVAKGLQVVTDGTHALQSTMAKSITEVSEALPAANSTTINGVQKTIEGGIEALGKNTSSSVVKTSVSTGMATETAIQVGQRLNEDKKP